jgi:putative YhdH/YhfP family quinone oxidoreductase
VLVKVEAAGFNYKDALACSGHPGVARQLPHVPGIDATGVLQEPADTLPAGTPVVVTGNGLGESLSGGFASWLLAPVDAVIRRPSALSAISAMALGTAGLTAVVAVERLAGLIDWRYQQQAGGGRTSDWLVTGASGGVGMLAVAAAAAAGHRVLACTRKSQVAEALRSLGAAEVLAPEDAIAPGGKPLASGRYTAVIDTVGGPLLAELLRSVRQGGAVASIGNAGGLELHTTVLPFILRGVTLAGIDAAGLLSNDQRRQLWPQLAKLWSSVEPHFPVLQLKLDGVGEWAERMLAGETCGRAVVIPAP